jgi:hypothetical protein
MVYIKLLRGLVLSGRVLTPQAHPVIRVTGSMADLLVAQGAAAYAEPYTPVIVPEFEAEPEPLAEIAPTAEPEIPPDAAPAKKKRTPRKRRATKKGTKT